MSDNNQPNKNQSNKNQSNNKSSNGNDSPVYQLGDEENFLEKLLFNNRVIWLIVFATLTIFFVVQTKEHFKIDSGFTKMLPMQHQYLQNMFDNISDLSTKGMSFQIVVTENDPDKDIFNKEYLQMIQEVHDEVFYINGVDRTTMRSFWAPSVIWMAVTPEGFKGGQLMPGNYDGKQESLNELRKNVLRSSNVGRLFANNFRSSMVESYLFNTYPENEIRDGILINKRHDSIDYQDLGQQLEDIRSHVKEKYGDKYSVYIIGDPKMIGDLIDGFNMIGWFFFISLTITFVLLYVYARCPYAAFVPLIAASVAVIWQMGALMTMAQHELTYGSTMIDGKIIDKIDGLGVFSMLVPFLIIAIGVSHSVQFVNAMVIETANGYDKNMAARRAFRQNYLPGLTALITDIFGFGTMALIPIGAIQELAIVASLGVFVLILSKIILLPILMSYSGISAKGTKHMKERFAKDAAHWTFFANCTKRNWATASLIIAFIAGSYGWYVAQGVKIGDVTVGSSELSPDAIYNQDVRYVIDNYSTSSDIFVVMVKTGEQECTKYEHMEAMDQLEWRLQNTEGVQFAVSPAYVTRQINAAFSEAHIKWEGLLRNQQTIDSASGQVFEQGMINSDCSFAMSPAFLTDHKAETLNRVVKTVEDFSAEANNDKIQFLMATGGSGIAAAVNQEIERAETQMLILVYSVVSVLVLLTYRSIPILICIMVPLYLTSILCEALMAYMEIGIKVATLPVIALGVGIGVDYAIYLYSRLDHYFQEGMPLREAYLNTLKTTGRAVMFTGFTLGIGVFTWTFSEVQFQKDMGILLVFMFVWNMIGAMWLMPALVHFLVKPEKMYPEAYAKAASNTEAS